MTTPLEGSLVSLHSGLPAKRRLRNFLLDPKFQLKYVGMLCGVAALLTASLSAVVLRNASEARAQATAAVAQAERASRESRTSAQVVHTSAMMTAGDNPELIAQIHADLRRAESELSAKLADARRTRDAIDANYRTTRWTLLVGGVLLVLLLGASGIVITHRLVGPVFKLKRLLRRVGAGRLEMHEGLRKNDELEDLFAAFLAMVASLRASREEQLAHLDAAISEADAAEVPARATEKLRMLRNQLRASLGDASAG
jgi:nitrogen fixation/metabolism regulation signal transduction histidine kinase